jgi:hypothetical protein
MLGAGEALVDHVAEVCPYTIQVDCRQLPETGRRPAAVPTEVANLTFAYAEQEPVLALAAAMTAALRQSEGTTSA